MTTSEEVSLIIGREPDQPRKHLYFCALLSKEAGLVSNPIIIVGGSAVELYTKGAYVSGDIDIVLSHKNQVIQVLQEWGFVKQGRLWARIDWSIAVDLVGETYTGDYARLRQVSTPYGAVLLAGVEDLIVKRLASAKHRRIPGDIEHAALLAGEFSDSIDWSYAREVAVKYEVLDLLEELLARLSLRGSKH